MGLPKLTKVSEETETPSSYELVDSVEEFCNSRFYLPSTDFNSNHIENDQLEAQRSKREVIEFLRTGDQIYCKECDFILTGASSGGGGCQDSVTRSDKYSKSNRFSAPDSSNIPNSISSVSSHSAGSNCSTVHSLAHSNPASIYSTIQNSLTKSSQHRHQTKEKSSHSLSSTRKYSLPPADLSICILHKPPAAYLQSELAEYNFTTITISAPAASSQKSDKQILEESIMRLFIDCKLASGELASLHALVSSINNSTAGSVFDYYSRIIVDKGLHQLKLKLLNKQLNDDSLPSGEQLFKKLAQVWQEFFYQILPIIECIFYRLRDTRNLTIKQTSLKRFRDELILKLEIHLEDALRDCLLRKKPIPNAIRQMLLILNNIVDEFPPNQKKIRLELLCVLVVDPFIGYRGLYLHNENDEPAIRSNEPEMYANQREPDVRQPSRPLSVQPNQMDSLSELFFNAIKKQSHKSHQFG